MNFKKCENNSIFFNDMEGTMKGYDDQVNTDKRYPHVKKNFLAFKQNLNMSIHSNASSFVLGKIIKDQATKFAIHFTSRVERTLQSYGPLLQLIRRTNVTYVCS